jgi:hypothetical protein
LSLATTWGGVDTFAWPFDRLKTNAEIVAGFATQAELNAVRLLVMPRGAIIDYDLTNNPLPLPVGWRFCNGDTVTGYGKLPDKRDRVSLGFNPLKANGPTDIVDQRNTDGSVIENYAAVGNTGGKPGVTLTIPELPPHSHPIIVNEGLNITHGRMRPGGNGSDDHPFSTQPAGGNAPHENRMPYVVSYFIVKVV